ncbi:MAG: histidinol-phosphate transaminase [Bacteroidetes bacterium]|nr:MAG: histidinol-phosphate transaminase [Bacteroidota bacterium]
MNIEQLTRPHIRDLKPYSSARDEFAGQADIFLDANENSLGSATEEAYNRYPDPLQRAIKAQLAPLKGVRPEQIFLGNGSDEPIDLLFRAFCEPKRDHVITMPPTYGMYQVSADLNQVKVVHVPLTDDFQINIAEVITALRPGTKLVFVCSPNNPSGNLMALASIELILQKAKGLVVVDEAYIDFAPEASLLPLLDRYPNLVVLQTFSKAWGLAGLRLGMAFAHPAVIGVLNKIKPPYNVNGLTQEKALEALAAVAKKDAMVATLLVERTRLAEGLAALPIVGKVYPSDANFLLVRMDDARHRYQQLMGQGTIVRDRSRLALCEGCLRITVGTPAENDALLAQLDALG